MKQIHKMYDRPFFLEPTKLTRIVGIMHDRLSDSGQVTLRDSFVIFCSGNHQEEKNNVQDVLDFDNSSKRRIERLLVTCTSSDGDRSHAQIHEIQIDFGIHFRDTTSGSSSKTVVTISIRSDDSAWANRTQAELEEQLERTWLPYTTHILAVLAVLLFLLTPLAIRFSAAVSHAQHQVNPASLFLTVSDSQHFEPMIRDGRTLTDQETRDLMTRQLRNVLTAAKDQENSNKIEPDKLLLIGVPTVTIFLCCLFLLMGCYPRAVFYWGDGEVRWRTTLQRRRILWSVIASVLIGGVVSNAFWSGIANWLNLS